MKILFIFTGGTIGSTLNGDYISADKSKSFSIIEAYKNKFGIDFNYEVKEPYAELSENNTGNNIRQLSACILENLGLGYDGIVVTHGTDTLQFSASAIGYALGNSSIPVCFVSANYPIENPLSNGLFNLHGAIKFIENKSGQGAFVIYRNSGSTDTVVHRATRLIASKAFSDEVDCVFGEFYGKFNETFNYVKNPAYAELTDEISPLNLTSLTQKCSQIMWLSPYPGMAYPEIHDNVKYILFNTYHSGTINTKSSDACSFFEKAQSRGVKVYITGVTDGPSYASVKAFANFNIIPIKNVSPVSAFVKLWIIADSNLNPDDYLEKSLAGDVAVRN